MGLFSMGLWLYTSQTLFSAYQMADILAPNSFQVRPKYSLGETS